MAILIILRLKKRIIQRYSLNPLHIDIIHKLGINIKENRHIHRLARVQPLLLKTKALNLGKILRHLTRRNGVCGYADDVFVRLVCGGVEGEGGFTGQDADFALLGDEFPGEDVGDGAVEGYADAGDVGDGFEALGGVAVGVCA